MHEELGRKRREMLEEVDREWGRKRNSGGEKEKQGREVRTRCQQPPESALKLASSNPILPPPHYEGHQSPEAVPLAMTKGPAPGSISLNPTGAWLGCTFYSNACDGLYFLHSCFVFKMKVRQKKHE